MSEKKQTKWLVTVVAVVGFVAVTSVLWSVVNEQARMWDAFEVLVSVDKSLKATDKTVSAVLDGLLATDELLVDEVFQVFDLSVLGSCGIITNGFGHGSCVAIRPDLVLTAGHCLDHLDNWIEIGGQRYEIIEQWTSMNCDVGFARIDGVLPCVELGNMPELLDVAYLIGSPYEMGLVNTITKGVISHLDRDIWEWNDLIQTDAEGAPGSSGCALFDVDGQVVGICVSGPMPGGGVILCVPVLDIRAALEEYDAQTCE